MFVEMVYNKLNVMGFVGTIEIILALLTKREHQVFPNAKVNLMQMNGLNSNASQSDGEELNRMLKDMFQGSDVSLNHKPYEIQ